MPENPQLSADQTPLTLGTKLFYGVGQLSDGVKQASFSTFLFFYYNQVLGLSGSLAGMAALLALIVDASNCSIDIVWNAIWRTATFWPTNMTTARS